MNSAFDKALSDIDALANVQRHNRELIEALIEIRGVLHLGEHGIATPIQQKVTIREIVNRELKKVGK